MESTVALRPDNARVHRGVSKTRRRRLIKRHGMRCAHCGIEGREVKHVSRRGTVSYTFPTSRHGVYLSIDHVVPKSRGGSHDDSNLQVLCTSCNSIKGAR